MDVVNAAPSEPAIKALINADSVYIYHWALKHSHCQWHPLKFLSNDLCCQT